MFRTLMMAALLAGLGMNANAVTLEPAGNAISVDCCATGRPDPDSLSLTTSSAQTSTFDFFTLGFLGVASSGKSSVAAFLGFDQPAGAADGPFLSVQPEGEQSGIGFLDAVTLTGRYATVKTTATMDSAGSGAPSATVPEPGSMALFGLAVLGLGLIFRRGELPSA